MSAGSSRGYRGRFAPSPTGPLHAGSLVAALASWLDARAHDGQWLLRIEDVDQPRCRREHGETILQQLAACGLVSDDTVLWQSQRDAAYAQALETLQAKGLAYGCACTRQDIAAHWLAQGRTLARHQEVPYPGTCRSGTAGRAARAWRLSTAGAGVVQWQDRRLGPQHQDLEADVGDVVLRRADGWWAYQLAVVVDDAAQGITHVVRGQDLADNTARQIWLQQRLGLPTPAYLHTPLVLGSNGEKLSKQNGAQALDLSDPVAALARAAEALGLAAATETTPERCLQAYVARWRERLRLNPRR